MQFARIILTLSVFLLAPIANAFEVSASFSSRKLDGAPERTNETEFTCTDTVYILMDVRNLKPGEHEMELQWIDPRGDRQELTQFQVYTQSDYELIWAWMRLHAPENSGLVRAFDQSHGMRDFIGRWKVKIKIDGEPAGNAYFNVLC